MDFLVWVYDLDSHDVLFEKRYPKQVGAIALGSVGMVVGCFAPGHLEWVSSLADASPRGGAADDDDDPEPWVADTDVNAIALNEGGGEMAVAAGNAVRIYCLMTRRVLYAFATGSEKGAFFSPFSRAS